MSADGGKDILTIGPLPGKPALIRVIFTFHPVSQLVGEKVEGEIPFSVKLIDRNNTLKQELRPWEGQEIPPSTQEFQHDYCEDEPII